MGIKQDVIVNFGPVDQRRGDKHLIPGRLTEAINVFQNKEDVFVKRNGFASYPRTADSGTVNTGEHLGAAGGAPILQTADSIYAFDVATNSYKLKGDYRPVMPSWETAMPTGYGGRPGHQIIGTNVWVVGKGQTIGGSGSSLWHYRVFNRDTLVEVQPPTPVTNSPGTIPLHSGGGRLIKTAGGNLFFVGCNVSAGPIDTYVAKFDTSNPATPPVLSLPMAGAALGTSLEGFDAIALDNGNILCAFWRQGGALTTYILNGTTGAIVGAAVNYTTGFTSWTSPGGFVKNATGATAYWCGLATNTFGTNTHVVELAITTATAVVAAAVTLEGPSTVIREGCGQIIGLLDVNGDRRYFLNNMRQSNQGPYATGFNNSKLSTITKYLRTAAGATTITNNWLRRHWPASDPFSFTLNGTLYWAALFGFDDEQYLGQKSWELIDLAAGRALARARWGDAGSINHLEAGRTGTQRYETGCATNVTVNGTKVRIAVGRQQSASGVEYSTDLLTFDVDPSDLAAPVEYDGNLIFPGGWPMQLSQDHVLRDIAPGQFPWEMTLTNPGGTLPAGTYTLSACYAFKFRDGRVVRSAPSPKQQIVLGAPGSIQASVPFLPLTNNLATNLDVFAELYVSAAGTTTPVMIQKSLTSTYSGGTGSVTFLVDVSIKTTEALYTDGGGLDQEPPPAFKAGCYAKKRIWLTGTPTKDTWISREILPGEAPGFNSELTIPVDGVAVGVVDDTYTAILTSTGAWVVSGNGKNDAGADGWDVKQLATQMGALSPHVVASPVGLFFVGLDGGIWLISREGQQVVYVGRGVDSHRGQTITGAAHVAKSQHVRFTTSNGKTLVFDYGRKPVVPSDVIETLGQWYVWTLPVAATATATVGGEQWYVEADGTLRKEVAGQFFDGSSTWYGMKLTMPLSFAGIAGYSRVSRGVFAGNYVAPHKLLVTLAADGASDIHGPKTVSAAPESFDFRPAPAKASSWTVTVEEQQLSSNLNAAFEFEGLGFAVMVKPGLRRVGSSQRI